MADDGSPALPERRAAVDLRRRWRLQRVRVRLWKVELAAFAAESGLHITVCHFPPGTSKWNKIEHRLFSHISMNWRGRPLQTHETVVELIAATTTRTGLKVQAELDNGEYPKGIKISDQQMAAPPLHRHDFHGDWNSRCDPNNVHEIYALILSACEVRLEVRGEAIHGGSFASSG